MADFIHENGRKPCLLYAVIDVSGSMGSQCDEGNKHNNIEEDQYSRLDLVKHTLNTIITSLSAQDQICVIIFSDSASVVIPLSFVVEDKKEDFRKLLDSRLFPDMSTNMWAGLKLAIDELTQIPETTEINNNSHNIQIFLLTDGASNLGPKDIPNVLSQYVIEHCPKHRLPVINTFGYGYSLESDLLYKLANEHGGVFGFLPDASMVGTVFVNTLSNVLVSKLDHGKPFTSMVHAKSNLIDAISQEVANTLQLITGMTPSGVKPTEQELPRLLQTLITSLQTRLQGRSHDTEDQEIITNVLQDIEATKDPKKGQMEKAIHGTFYKKWGRHYLLSLCTAYERQICINFKDMGITMFKNTVFEEEQSRIEDIFVSIPPPIPYRRHYNTAFSAAPSAAPSSAPVTRSMHTYYDASGGCFTGHSLVYSMSTTPDDDEHHPALLLKTEVSSLHRGSLVLSNYGVTKIEAVVKLWYHGPLYRVGESMYLTAYHPVMIDGQCAFPYELCGGKAWMDEYVGYVYDVILEDRGIVQCPFTAAAAAATEEKEEEFFVASFGHRVVNEIFQHAYFGSEDIVEDLKKHPGWLEGLIVIDHPEYIRCSEGDVTVLSDGQHNRIVRLVF